MNKQKLNKILNILTPDETTDDFKVFDNQVADLKNNLKEKIQVKTLADVNEQIDSFRRRIDLQPLLDTMDRLEQTFNDRSDELNSQLEEKHEELGNLLSTSQSDGDERATTLAQQIESLRTELALLEENGTKNTSDLKDEIENIKSLYSDSNEAIDTLRNSLDKANKGITTSKSSHKEEVKSIENSLENLRSELNNRINLLKVGGGSMNRKLTFNAVDYLTRYTDINYKAGTNVTFTVANNDQTKMVDVTISATGGGGAGIVRLITNITTDTTADSASGTDYVYLCSGTLTLTLSSAVGNTNLYTVKNVGSGTVTINTTSSQTIDGNLTIQMATRFTSVDLISDTANWSIT